MTNTNAKRDDNGITVLIGTSNGDGVSTLPVYVDSATNRLLVNATITGTVTVTGSSGGTSMTDDAAFTPGTTAITPAGAMFDDVSPDSVDEGDGGVLRMSGRRELYIQIRDAAGNERGANVNASGQVSITGPVTNAGTFVVQENGAALTSLQLIDDIIKTDDAAFTPATDKVAMAGFEYDDTGTDSVDEGDAGAARMSANRNIYIQIRDAAGNERGVNVNASGQLNITGPVTNAGTFAVQESGAALTSLQLIDDVIFTDDAAFTPATSKVAAIGFQVDDTATDSVDEGDIGAPRMSADRVIYIQGPLAHDAADSGNPVKIGNKAKSSLLAITLVSANDRTDAYADIDGIPIVKALAPGADFLTERVSNTDGNSTAFSTFGATANLFNYVTSYSIFRTDAGTSPIYVDFRSGTAGSIIWSVVIPPNGGANLAGGAFPLFKTLATNTALAYDVSAATTTVYISITGYQSKV